MGPYAEWGDKLPERTIFWVTVNMTLPSILSICPDAMNRYKKVKKANTKRSVANRGRDAGWAAFMSMCGR